MKGTGAVAASRRGGKARRAEAEVERDYARLKPEILRTVRGKLAAAGTPIDIGDLDASYNQAWHALYAELRAGVEIANRKGFLVQLTYRRAVDELRAARRARPAGAGEPDEAGADPDLDGLLDDRIRLRQLVQGLRERLGGRELRAAALCYVHGYSRPEAAQALGVGRRRMEKIMDSASKEVTALVGELRSGEWCESRRSLIGAYALGLLDAGGERRRLAEEHLRDCPACRHRVLCMRGLAAVAPPVSALLAALQADGGAAAARSDATGGNGSAGRPQGDRRTSTKVGATAAAIAIAIALAAVGLGNLGSDGAPSTPVSTGAAAPAASPPLAADGRAKTARRRRNTGNRSVKASVEAAAPPQALSTPPAAEPPPAEAAPATATPPPQPDPPPPPAAPPAGDTPLKDGWSEFELR